jgi:cell division protein FtsW (lipid II flippase)
MIPTISIIVILIKKDPNFKGLIKSDSNMNRKIFGIIFSLFFILVATRSIEQINWLSSSAPAFFLYFILTGLKNLENKELSISLLLIGLFGIWAMITAFWSPYPWNTFIRGFVFFVSSWGIIMAGFYWAKNFSKNEFGFLISLNILLLIVSVFSLATKIPSDYWVGYGFGLKSFWAHQNTLGSLIILTIPGIFIMPLKDKKIRIMVTLILFVLNFYVLILTHSRTSFGVLLISIFLFIFLTKRFRFLGIIMLLCSFLATFYFINKDFQSALNDYIFKTEVSLLDRKNATISATYEAAGHGGWKGLGYGVSDNTVIENLQVNLTYHFEGARLVREKTVSIYALVEETGWIGLTLFLFFVAYLFYLTILTYLKTKEWTSALVICVLIGMCLHAQFEGWWLGIGSVQFPLFMGVAGIAIGKYRINSEKK